MPKRGRSWVWQYAKRIEDKAYCNLCNQDACNEFACPGGTTGSLGRHLSGTHGLNSKGRHDTSEKHDEQTLDTENAETLPIVDGQIDDANGVPNKRKRQGKFENKNQLHNGRPCSRERIEIINRSLAEMIAVNQLPISFCSSEGFLNFMAVVEPNYKPCQEEAIKTRLTTVTSNVKELIKMELRDSQSISCTSDCWTSIAQESYITVTAHTIDSNWCPKSFTLTTNEVDRHHTAENLVEQLINIFHEWNISEKVSAVVTDNAKNIVNSIPLISSTNEIQICSIKCAAHSLQLTVNHVLKNESIRCLIKQCNKVVGHFKHSTLAMKSLEKRQEQMGLSKTALLKSCKTQWNSVYLMLERLHLNRCAIFNVLSDENITNRSIAEKLEIKETEWTLIDPLIKVLKPIHITTTVLCTGKHSSISMIRPIIKTIIEKHLLHSDDDDNIIQNLKKTIVLELERRFSLDWSPTEQILPEQIASFLDPRYKYLEHETLNTREEIRSRVKEMLSMSDTINLNDKTLNNLEDQKKCHQSDLEYIYGTEFNNDDDLTKQFENYVAEPQLRFTLDPKEWWKTRFSKYPAIGNLAKKYLTIPATSVSSERCFSTAGNIVNRKRASLSPENVNMLVFLHQNKHLLNKTC